MIWKEYNKIMINIYDFAYNGMDKTSKINGPFKVSKNLFMGLNNLNIDYVVNTESEFNVCINPPVPNRNMMLDLPKNTVFGPNIWNLPTDEPHIFNECNHFIVASDWYKDLWSRYTNKKIHTWCVGIDTTLFNVEKDIKYDCFIYLKNRSDNMYNEVLKPLAINKNVLKTVKWKNRNELSFSPMWNNPNYKGAEDYEFCMEVLKEYNKSILIDSKIYYYA